MNPDETGIMLTAMRAMWPNHTPTDDEIRLWAAHLGARSATSAGYAVDFDDAIAVLGVLERTTRFWPHWSEFTAVHGPILRRRREVSDQHGIGSGRPSTREENQVWLAHCRDILAKARGPLAVGLDRALQ